MSQHSRPWPPFTRRALYFPAIALIVLLACALSACGVSTTSDGTGTGGGVPTSTPMPSATATTAATPTTAAFTVTSVDLTVDPASIAGTSCGSSASFTYTATFHIPANTAGGTIQFAYTLNNGRSQTPGTVTVAPGQTSKTFTFNSSGVLAADHTYPGNAIVMVTSPNNLISPSAQPSGACA